VSARVELPSGVRPPFEVYVNGVPQTLGTDYRVTGGELRFTRELHSAKPGFWAWFIGIWGIGTYEKNDVIDVRYTTADGGTTVAHALPLADA
jgi:hypothetical protein